MGEKSGGLTNMIIALVATVAIILIVQVAFPDLTEKITGGMTDIVDNSVKLSNENMLGTGENAGN